MDLLARITEAQKEAQKARDAARLSTLRLILAAAKDREISMRTTGTMIGDAEVLALLGKMVKQRQESARIYSQGGRPELEAKELAEVLVIEEFLPRALDAQETSAAIDAAIAEAEATGIKDMGKVMAVLKRKYTGQMDFSAAGALIKARLG